MDTREIVTGYYHAWLASDREGARSLLADDLKFKSPHDRFDFCCGELLKVRDGRISEIYVTFEPTR
jgi:ketosteroid isomerase-like protein